MNYQNVFCFTCKTQCIDISEKLKSFTEGVSIEGCQCPKCRTLHAVDEGMVDGKMVQIVEAQMEEEAK